MRTLFAVVTLAALFTLPFAGCAGQSASDSGAPADADVDLQIDTSEATEVNTTAN